MQKVLLFLMMVASAAGFVTPGVGPVRVALRAEAETGEDAVEAAAVPEVNSGKEAIELLLNDPEGYKAAREEYDKKVAEDIRDEAPVDRGFFLQAAGVGIGSFAFGIFNKQQGGVFRPKDE